MKRSLFAVLTAVIFAPAWANVEINETNFPDYSFRSFIQWSSFNEDYDNVLTSQEIANATSINVGSYSIANLKGIEFFTALTELNCTYNQLTSLDLSKNKALTSVSCYSNQLNVEAMDALIASLPTVNNGKFYVSCSYNESNLCTATHITAAKAKGWTAYDSDGNEFAGVVVLCHIDESSFPDENFRSYLTNNLVDSNGDGYLTDTEAEYQTYFDLSDKGITTLKGIEFFTKLTSLYCQNNQLTSLDVSMNTELTDLYCYSNKISGAQMDALVTSLPQVSYGTFRVIDTSNENEGNTCSVSQVETATSNGWEVFYQVGGNWDTYYGIMPILMDDTVFPDANFRGYVASSIDTDQDGKLSTKEISNVYHLDVSRKGIYNLKGIELFTTLNTLYCNNNQLTSLDLSKNTALTALYCYGNQIYGTQMDALITSLPDTGGNIYILNMYDENEANACTVEQANAINDKKWKPKFTMNGYDWQSYTGVLPIKVNEENFPDEGFRNIIISNYGGYDGYLTDEEVAQFTEMRISSTTTISNLKGIEYYTALTKLTCQFNSLTTVDLSKNTMLSELDLAYNRSLTTLDLSKNAMLTKLNLSSNSLTTLNLSKNTNLTDVDCSSNQLVSIILSKDATLLSSMRCYDNKISLEAMNAMMASLPTVSGGQLIVSVYADKESNVCTTDHVATAKAKGWTICYSYGDEYKGKKILFQITEDIFPDNAFRAYVSSHAIDREPDGYLTEDEIAQVQSINIEGMGVESLKGIDKFTAMTSLNCSNNELKSLALDLAGMTALSRLKCSNNQLESLDLSKNTALTWLNCSDNKLTSLDLSKNTALTELNCTYNKLESLDLSRNTALTRLDCSYNQLTSLITSSTLTYLWCYSNLLTALDLSKNTVLTEVNCAMNKILGENMDVFISQLPSVDDGKLKLTNTMLKDEQVCFRDHIKEAIAKGWEVIEFLSEDLNTWGTYSGDLGIKAVEIASHFPDKIFREYISSHFDSDKDGILSVDEIKNISSIDVTSMGITSLEGVGYLKALGFLVCDNNQLTSLDLSENICLYFLQCQNNKLTTLDYGGVGYLLCGNNQLTTLNIIEEGVGWLDCSNNKLSTLDISNCGFEYLDCSNNLLTSLDLSRHGGLKQLSCHNNKLKSIVLPKYLKLTSFPCYHNRISGKATDDLIESLPIVDKGTLYFIDINDEDEGNTCSPLQVAAAESKGWDILYNVEGDSWAVFPGNIIKGDVNGDGKIDKIDLEMVVSAIMGQKLEDAEIKKADVNGDKAVNAADVMAVVSLINYAGQDNLLMQIPKEDLNGWELGYCLGDEYIVAYRDKTDNTLVTMINKNGASIERGLILCFNDNNEVVSAGTMDKLYDVRYEDENIILSRIDEEGILEEVKIPINQTANAQQALSRAGIPSFIVPHSPSNFTDVIVEGVNFVGNVMNGTNIAIDLTNWKWDWGTVFDGGMLLAGRLLNKVPAIGAIITVGQIVVDHYRNQNNERQRIAIYGNCTISIDEISSDNGNSIVYATVKNANNLYDYLFNMYDRTINEKTRNLVSCGIVVRHHNSYVTTHIYDYKSQEVKLNDDINYGPVVHFSFTIPGLDLTKNLSTYYFRPYLTSTRLMTNRGDVNEGHVKYGEVVPYTSFNGELKEFKQTSAIYSTDEDGQGFVEFVTYSKASISSLDNIEEWGIYVLNDDGTYSYKPSRFKAAMLEDEIKLIFNIIKEGFDEYNNELFIATKKIRIGVYQKLKNLTGIYDYMSYFYSEPQEFELIYDEKPNITFTDVTVKETEVTGKIEDSDYVSYNTHYTFDCDIKGSFWFSTIQHQIISSSGWINHWNKQKITNDDSYSFHGYLNYHSGADMSLTMFYQMYLINGTTVNSTNSLVVGGVPGNPTITLGGAPNTSQVRTMTRNNNSDKPNCITSFVSMRKKQKEADKE